MISAKIILCILGTIGLCAIAKFSSSHTPAQNKHIVIAASTLLDGKGGVLYDTHIVIEGSPANVQ